MLQSVHGIFAVEDTLKVQAAVFGHHGVVRTGKITVGNGVAAKVDIAARARTTRHHSATHLMHKALRETLGDHVQQKGSQVDPDKTRFDFIAQPADDRSRDPQGRRAIVNAEILANAATEARVMKIEDAQKIWRDDALRREVRRRSARANRSARRRNCAAARTSPAPATSACSRSSASGVAAGVRRVEARLWRCRAGLARRATGHARRRHRRTQRRSRRKSSPKVGQMVDQVKALERTGAAEVGSLPARVTTRRAGGRRQGIKVLGRCSKAPTSPRCARPWTS